MQSAQRKQLPFAINGGVITPNYRRSGANRLVSDGFVRKGIGRQNVNYRQHVTTAAPVRSMKLASAEQEVASTEQELSLQDRKWLQQNKI